MSPEVIAVIVLLLMAGAAWRLMGRDDGKA